MFDSIVNYDIKLCIYTKNNNTFINYIQQL